MAELTKEKLSKTELKIISKDQGGKLTKLQEWIYRLKTNDITPYTKMAHAKSITKMNETKITQPCAIRIKYHCDNKEKIFDEILHKLNNPKIDLSNPATVINVFKFRNRQVFGTNVKTDKSFKLFDPKNLPFRVSITMKPKIARFMVNIANLKGKVLDPLVGTGLLLLNASVYKCTLYGSDISEELIDGAKTNFRKFRIRVRLKVLDIRKIRQWKIRFDRIISDLPYGTSSSSSKMDLLDFYKLSLRSMKSVLKPDGRIVICIPRTYKTKVIKYAKSIGLKTLYNAEQHVHSSLTRCFLVFEFFSP